MAAGRTSRPRGDRPSSCRGLERLVVLTKSRGIYWLLGGTEASGAGEVGRGVRGRSGHVHGVLQVLGLGVGDGVGEGRARSAGRVGVLLHGAALLELRRHAAARGPGWRRLGGRGRRGGIPWTGRRRTGGCCCSCGRGRRAAGSRLGSGAGRRGWPSRCGSSGPSRGAGGTTGNPSGSSSATGWACAASCGAARGGRQRCARRARGRARERAQTEDYSHRCRRVCCRSACRCRRAGWWWAVCRRWPRAGDGRGRVGRRRHRGVAGDGDGGRGGLLRHAVRDGGRLVEAKLGDNARAADGAAVGDVAAGALGADGQGVLAGVVGGGAVEGCGAVHDGGRGGHDGGGRQAWPRAWSRSGEWPMTIWHGGPRARQPIRSRRGSILSRSLASPRACDEHRPRRHTTRLRELWGSAPGCSAGGQEKS